uniref:tyrosine-type recombinase/integrase n=1 Tax=Sphingobium yanoikuyae TaxID=13690 RepID=UPI0028AFDF66
RRVTSRWKTWVTSQWKSTRCRNVEQGYGQWLSFLTRNDGLDMGTPPEERVTPDSVHLFATQLRERVSSCSAAMVFEGFARMIMVMAPEHDWNWLRIVITNLKANARPEKDKRGHMVDAVQLLALGVDLMEQALEMGALYHAATRMRDGLLVAILASCPVRIANLTAIEIGRHLLFDRDRYRLFFTEEETKTAHPYQAELSPALSPYIDIWLRNHRRRLLALGDGAGTDRLWIDRWGKAMGDHAIREQIEKRTRDAFGRHIWPHLARSIAATSIVDHAPDMVALVPDLLGHSIQQTAHKHYILAHAARAHTAVQSAFEERRMAALDRFRGQKGLRHAG